MNQITDLFLFLQLPGSGDDLQGIKRGIMEIADIIFVNKVDVFQEKQIKDLKVDLSRSLQFLPNKKSEWKRKTVLGSGLKEKGIVELWDIVIDYFDLIHSNGFYLENRRSQQLIQSETYLLELMERRLKEKLRENPLLKTSDNAYEIAKEWMKENI